MLVENNRKTLLHVYNFHKGDTRYNLLFYKGHESPLMHVGIGFSCFHNEEMLMQGVWLG